MMLNTRASRHRCGAVLLLKCQSRRERSPPHRDSKIMSGLTMQRRHLQLAAIAPLLCWTVGCGVAVAQGDETFDRDVAPILQKHCVECHGPDDPEAKLRLSTRDGLLYGSASGRILVPGKAKESLMLRLLSPGSKPHMPPEGQLNDAEIAAITRWVDRLSADALPKREGAGSSDHWAYQPLTKPVPPQVKNTAWVKNPIDRFILAKLEAAGLTPAPEADAATLCRRLYFDLDRSAAVARRGAGVCR